MIRNAAIAGLFLICTVSTLGAISAREKLALSQQRLGDAIAQRDLARTETEVMRKAAAAQEAERVALIARIDAISQKKTARAVKLEKVQREDRKNADWADARLPADIASVLDYRAAAD